MNNVYICQGRNAKKAYFIKFSEISIYSVEELCYYFMENIYVIDSDIMSLELLEWLREECNLGELSKQLMSVVRKKDMLTIFVTTILEYVGLYDQDEIKRAAHILKEQELKTPFERWKKKAEYEYQSGRFHQAQRIYEAMLADTPVDDSKTRALLLYNLGSVLAMDFAFEAAAEYYYESYQIQKSQRTRIAYILAVKQMKSDFEYGNFKREHGDWIADFERVDHMCEQTRQEWEQSKTYELLQKLKNDKEAGKVGEYQQKREELLYQLKKDFRRQTV